MEQVSADEARKNFAELLNQVRYQGKHIVITRRGKPMAKLVPMAEEDLEGCDSPPA